MHKRKKYIALSIKNIENSETQKMNYSENDMCFQ